MKRPALALAAAIVLGSLLPGMASAIVIPGVLDQANPAGTPTIGAADDLAQTFTAGKSGLLDEVRLWLDHTDALSVRIESTTAGVPDGNVLATSPQVAPSNTPGWVSFAVLEPVPVNAGTMYAIVFNTNETGADAAYGSGDTYAGGQAYLDLAGTWGAVSGTLLDFAFQTYVDPQTVALQWDKTQLVAGTTSPLTLTETLVFPRLLAFGLSAQPAVPGSTWSVTSVNLPTWFSVASVACSSQILTTDCTPANVVPGASINVTPDGNPVTLTLTGTASPTAAGAANGKAQACVAYNVVLLNLVPAGNAQPALTMNVCVSDQQAVNVVAAAVTPGPTPAPTLPPTSTGRASAPNEPGFVLWLLPLCLAAMGGSLFLVGRRLGRLR